MIQSDLFYPQFGGSLNLWRGHLTIPKRTLWITRYSVCCMVVLSICFKCSICFHILWRVFPQFFFLSNSRISVVWGWWIITLSSAAVPRFPHLQTLPRTLGKMDKNLPAKNTQLLVFRILWRQKKSLPHRLGRHKYLKSLLLNLFDCATRVHFLFRH